MVSKFLPKLRVLRGDPFEVDLIQCLKIATKLLIFYQDIALRSIMQRQVRL